MADRKGRKAVASNSKAAARVAAALTGPMGLGFDGTGERTEPVPFEGMSGTGATVPVPSDQPLPRDLRANEPIQRAWEAQPGTPPQTGIQGVAATAVAGVEWGNRVTTPTDNVARVFELISTTLAALRSGQALDGDNQASERNEAIDNFEVYIRLGNTSIRVVREQTQSQAPSKAVVEQNATAFEAVATGAKTFRRRLLEFASLGLTTGALQQVGKIAVDHYHPQINSLLEELERQIGALLLELPNLIDGLHHWAALIVS